MKDKIYICIIVVLLIIVIIMGIQIGKGAEKPTTKEEKTSSKIEGSNEVEEVFINLNENLSKEGTVEGVEELSWSHVKIDEDESFMRVDMTLENRTEKKVEAKKLQISLYNKAGKKIATKEVDTPEIEASKHHFINLEIPKENGSDYEVIYDVKITSR